MQFNAQKTTIIGEVASPGQFQITNVPMSLLDALNLAGRSKKADLSNIILRRDEKEYSLDLEMFINNGDLDQNPIILPGDVIIVNEVDNGSVFTFGETRVGEIALTSKKTSLTSLLASRGGVNSVRANAHGVFIFREKLIQKADQAKITVFQFELDKPVLLVLARAFEMKPGDVVFITQDPISRWNDTVNKLLSPVLTTMRAQKVVKGVVDDVREVIDDL
jgi:polysaccharide export outer membrane protein